MTICAADHNIIAETADNNSAVCRGRSPGTDDGRPQRRNDIVLVKLHKKSNGINQAEKDIKNFPAELLKAMQKGHRVPIRYKKLAERFNQS